MFKTLAIWLGRSNYVFYKSDFLASGCFAMVAASIKQELVLKLSPRDNVLVALSDLRKDETIACFGSSYTLATDVPVKHKFAAENLAAGSDVIMYGVLVGKATKPIAQGEVLTPRNTQHEAAPYHEKTESYRWTPPEVSRWCKTTFQGYRRPDGQVDRKSV